MTSPRLNAVACSSPMGLHRMAYSEWGASDNPRVVLCVHGLTRSGRDFDVLAAELSKEYRVICPDVAGRGLSDRLLNPSLYGVSQYVADMVSLLNKIQPEQLHWIGTSMGGLIGLGYLGALEAARFSQSRQRIGQAANAAVPVCNYPVHKLVLNDVGPHLEPASLTRIGEYVGAQVSLSDFSEAVNYLKFVSQSFGPHTDEQWHALTRHYFIEDDGHWIKHYDMDIAVPFKAMTPELVAQGEMMLWSSYASYKGPVLITRGAESDLLSSATLAKMLSINPLARSAEFAGVGHAPTLMQADQIAVITKFLND